MSRGSDQSDSSGSCSDSSNTNNTEQRKNADFSISAILSDDTGASSRRSRGTPVQACERRISTGMLVSPPALTEKRLFPGGLGTSVSMSTPSRYTPRLYASPGPLSQSLSCSPFTGLLLPLSPSPGSTVVSSGHGRFDFETDDNTSGKEGCEDGLTCNDSLGILSTVALYHSEQSGGESKREEGMNGSQETSGITTSVGDGMARMKLESSSDTTLSVAEDRQSIPPHPPSPPYYSTMARGKVNTPFILKRDRKRRRQLAEAFAQNSSTTTEASKTTINSLQLPSHANTEHLSSVTQLDTGFLSPTSAQQQSSHHLSFSPSIFLSQPANTNIRRKHNLKLDTTHPPHDEDKNHSSTADRRHSASGNDIAKDNLTVVERERKNSISSDPQTLQVSSSFATSTPVKHDKENAQTTGFQLSPTCLSPSESGGKIKRPRLRDTGYETSSGSDSDVPVSKCRSRLQAVRCRNKARAQLSPLLENACSPIAKADNTRIPSSLLTANFPASSSSIFVPPPLPLPESKQSHTRLQQSLAPENQQPITPTVPHPPPISIPAYHPQPPIPFPFTTSYNPFSTSLPPYQPNLYMGMMPVATNAFFPTQTLSTLSPPHAPYLVSPRPSPAVTTLLQPPTPFYYYNTPHQMTGYSSGYPSGYPSGGRIGAPAVSGDLGQKWGGSPLSTQWEKTGQIQSVPPWYIFEQNRPEGKRLRLTEAINRSLSETPSHNPKLPAGWTKYACGQTDDQIMLTQRARMFLQSGRRQLTFDNIST